MSGSDLKTFNIPFPVYNHTLPNFFINPDKNLSRYKHSILAFSHTPKSGGTTMKRCMKTVSELSGKRSPLIVNGPSCISTRLALLTGKLREEMIDSFAGSLLGICDHLKRKNCAYFTIMRDPYDRLISHYFFCKAGKQTFLSCENKTIVEFARRVGSTVFTQLSAQFKCLREREIGIQNETWRCYKKDFAYEPQSSERDLMLAYLVENLESLFAVIGLTEEFDFSLKLLQRTFGWSFFDKCKGEKFNVGSYFMNNSDSVSHSENWQKLKAREIILDNEEIRDALYPDVVLYQRAKEIFQKEKEAFLKMNSL
ncbi:hypothetical protein HOLleu_16099 [Holothuria leucospilota]|uniref:Sulfotransferase family protein n=1 Tax=Holothuria leucospilota TaxID=206669 RepID=A0A9Q1C4R7_HOLLE|nr:hypothetical protein HOLleu_16099 [Holothuria leucospilota]